MEMIPLDRNTVVSRIEIEYVEMLCNGLTITKIAEARNMSRRTLEAQIDRLKVKCGVVTLPELVYVFMKHNLIE